LTERSQHARRCQQRQRWRVSWLSQLDAARRVRNGQVRRRWNAPGLWNARGVLPEVLLKRGA